MQRNNKDAIKVSYDFNSFYPSAQADKNSTWPAMETSYPFKKYMDDALRQLFNSKKWDELNKYASTTIKYHNLESVYLQHIPKKENIKNPYENNRLQEINRSPNCIIYGYSQLC